jgi:hypothetical protein
MFLTRYKMAVLGPGPDCASKRNISENAVVDSIDQYAHQCSAGVLISHTTKDRTAPE